MYIYIYIYFFFSERYTFSHVPNPHCMPEHDKSQRQERTTSHHMKTCILEHLSKGILKLHNSSMGCQMLNGNKLNDWSSESSELDRTQQWG